MRNRSHLVEVRVIQEMPDLLMGVMIVDILGKVNFLFLDCPNETLGAAVLPGFALVGHADLDPSILKGLDIGRGCILDPLVRMVNLWSGIPVQRPPQIRMR